MALGRVGRWTICLGALAAVSSAGASAPVISDANGRLRAEVLPAEGWCSAVVSADVRATKEVFEKYPEDVQKFIAAMRLGIVTDCPIAEIIRMRGLVDGAAVFRAYTDKGSDWRIQVFSSVDGILSMLEAGLTPPQASQKQAYFETRTQFDRAKLSDLALDSNDATADSDHVSWKITGIDGTTYVFNDRQKTFATLGSLADASAHQLAQQCADGNGAVDAPSSGDIASNIQSRSFTCVRGDDRKSYGLVSNEMDKTTTIFAFSSDSKSAVDLLVKYLSDVSITY